MIRSPRLGPALLGLGLVCFVRSSFAQEAPAPDPTVPGGSPPAPVLATPAREPEEPVDDAELADIEGAIAADAKDRPNLEASSPSPGPAGGGVQSIQPDLAIIGGFALAAFSEKENHQTGGHDPTENGFNLQQLELAFGAAADPYLRLDGNLVFSLEGVELEEAYATTLGLPYRLQARFGQLLTRFGRLNATHPHAWDFVDQPIALGRVFGGEGNRGLGVELSYLAPLPWYVELVFSSTRADGEGTARSFFGEENPGVEGLDDLLYVGAIKQFFALSDAWSLLVGLSGAFGPNASGTDNRSEVYGADVFLKYRPPGPGRAFVGFQSEWMYRRRQIPGDVLSDFSGYAQLVYQVSRYFSAAARYELGTPARTRAGDTGADPLDPEWTRDRSRVSANITHYPTEFSRFRLQGSRDAGLGEPVWAAFLAAEVLIGAHGAHTF